MKTNPTEMRQPKRGSISMEVTLEIKPFNVIRNVFRQNKEAVASRVIEFKRQLTAVPEQFNSTAKAIGRESQSVFKDSFRVYSDALSDMSLLVEGVFQKLRKISAGKSTHNQDDKEPPKLAEYLLYFFLSRIERENAVGDLVEEYSQTIIPRFGSRWGRIWFYKQVFTSLWPLARRVILKWAIFGWVAELIRRIGS